MSLIVTGDEDVSTTHKNNNIETLLAMLLKRAFVSKPSLYSKGMDIERHIGLKSDG